MSLETIRAAIVAKIEGVAGIGTVHPYERYAVAQEAFRQLYLTGTDVDGWFVRRVQTIERSRAIGRYMEDHRWAIRGFRSLVDAAASELAFDATIEAMRDAFRADETLSGAVDSILVGELAGLQVDDSGPVMFAGVLCHAAHLTLWTRSTRTS